MTSIQTKEDFLRALADDPAFKTAVRDALMSEVLADILDELRESRKIQELMLASIGRMSGDINSMSGRIDSMATDIGHLIGDNLERKMGYALPSELRTGYGVREMSVLVYPAREDVVTPEFLNDLDAARASGTITEDERARVLNTDMIISELGDDGQRTRFFAAEASNSINNDDIDRAVRTAEIMEKIHGLPVVPIAFGHQVGDAVRRYNNREGRRRVRIITLNR